MSKKSKTIRATKALDAHHQTKIVQAAVQEPEPYPSLTNVRYSEVRSRLFGVFIDCIILLFLLMVLFPGSTQVGFGEMSEDFKKRSEEIALKAQQGQISFTEYMGETINLGAEMKGGWAKYLTQQGLMLVVIVVASVLGWVYLNPSPGKKAMHLQVVDSTSLSPINGKRMFCRYLAYLVSLLPLGFGFLWMLFNKKRQCLHDVICKTVVIHDAPLDPNWRTKRLKQQTIIAILLILGMLAYSRIVGQ